MPSTSQSTLRSSAPARGGCRLLQALERHAATRPASPAIIEFAAAGARTLSYGELTSQAASRAAQLAARLPADATVLLAQRSGADYVIWFCAAVAAGVRVLPAPAQSSAPELVELAGRARAVAVIGAQDVTSLPRLEDMRTAPRAARLDSILEKTTRPAGSVVLLSSGTTGGSKLVWRRAPALDADGENVIAATRMNADDRLLAPVSLAHSYGLDLLLATLIRGAALEVPLAFDPLAIASRLGEGATMLAATPYLLEGISGAAPRGRGALRLVFTAGAPCPPAVREAFEAAWDVRVGDLYGATELGTVTFNHPQSPGFKAGSVGAPLPGVSVRIVDPDDHERLRPPGEEGHVAIAAPSMLTVYLDGDVPLTDGHLLTGDLGRVDAAGRLSLTGRLKLIIETGGVKVNPLDVEAVLAAHPQVRECVVLPLRVSDTVTRLRAVYVPADPAAPPPVEELRRHLRGRLGPAKIPRRFDAVPALLKSPAGKVLRAALAEVLP